MRQRFAYCCKSCSAPSCPVQQQDLCSTARGIKAVHQRRVAHSQALHFPSLPTRLYTLPNSYHPTANSFDTQPPLTQTPTDLTQPRNWRSPGSGGEEPGQGAHALWWVHALATKNQETTLKVHTIWWAKVGECSSMQECLCLSIF